MYFDPVTRGYYVSTTSPVGSMILLTDRENANTCSGLEMDSPNKTSGLTPGVKFPGVYRAGSRPSSWAKRRVVETRSTRVTRRAHASIAHGDLTYVMREPSRVTRGFSSIFIFFFYFFINHEFSKKLVSRRRIRSARMR